MVRTAFSDPEKFSICTGFRQDLIEDFNDLLTALTCGEVVDPDAYHKAAQDWQKRFHSDYNLNWNWESQTVHTVLEHGRDILLALPFTDSSLST